MIIVCNTGNYFDVSIELIWQFTAENENSKSAKPSLVELFFVDFNYFQHGIMWTDLDLLYPIWETGCQYFGCFIHYK